MTRVSLGKSRVRESRMPGSVRAKAEWLSYSSTTELPKDLAFRFRIGFHLDDLRCRALTS